MNPICPYCSSEIAGDDPGRYECPSCGAAHHAECWAENRGCTVFGCEAAPPEEPKVQVGVEDLSALPPPPPPASAGLEPPPPPPPPPPWQAFGQPLSLGGYNPAPMPVFQPPAGTGYPPPPPANGGPGPSPPPPWQAFGQPLSLGGYNPAPMPVFQPPAGTGYPLPPPPPPPANRGPKPSPPPSQAFGQPLSLGGYNPAPMPVFQPPAGTGYPLPPKCRSTFVVLGVFLGIFGIHNFYAGYHRRGAVQLCITLCTVFFGAIISWIWALVEVCTVDRDSHNIIML